ncbi:hypothetical protein GOP47_0005312 [Adiantum capillus-veneris]|uniref:Uncharacterized protein n=1 Tax=Adiantum capillus-veneris TaxID=13818 RepID=A0A9D4V603_ADICA|nr:hypothetical protein GOP47_0005312 [Adiantum capillus-veneris]
MFATRASLFAARVAKAAAKAPPPPAFELPPSKIVENLLIQHGPQTVSGCWTFAEPAGIKSKIRLKALLMWLVGRNRIRQFCHVDKETKRKEFLFGPWKKASKLEFESSEAAPPQESTAA